MENRIFGTCYSIVSSHFCQRVYSISDIPGPGPVAIVPVPSLIQISLTWSEPATPNGIITGYEVSYGPKNFSRLSSVDTGLVKYFHVRVKLGAEFTFTVRAFTRAGAGEPATVVVSTLTQPRKLLHVKQSMNINPKCCSCCRG